MRTRGVSMTVLAMLAFAAIVAAEPPDPDEVVTRSIAAQGGEEFAAIGILRLEVSEEETTRDGERHTRAYTVLVDTANLAHARMEMPGRIVIACGIEGCWATRGGEIDGRVQAPKMARKTLNQTVFPLLLPYSLKMVGVQLGDRVEAIEWEGRPAWMVPVDFARGFFATPIMATTWYAVFAKDDGSLLAAHFLPPAEYQKAQTEGIRYRTLATSPLEDAGIPRQILLDGLDLRGIENGHVEVVKIDASVYGPSEPTAFMRPE